MKFKIDLPSFLLSFAIGMLYIYLSTPPHKVVVKFPTPFNAGKVVYQDASENCFKISAEKLECPKDKGLIKPHPISSTG